MAIIIFQFLYYFSTKLCILTNFSALFPTEGMNFRSLACIQIFAIAKWVIFNVNTIITLFYRYHPRFILHPYFLIRVLSSIRIFSSSFYPPSAFSYPRFIPHPHFLIRHPYPPSVSAFYPYPLCESI